MDSEWCYLLSKPVINSAGAADFRVIIYCIDVLSMSVLLIRALSRLNIAIRVIDSCVIQTYN